METILTIVQYVVPFLIVLTVLVFVHELGHYLVARWAGVRVEVFSIGFGREVFGWNDKHGTRWKIAWLPLGGYVKFFGDMNAASAPNGRVIDNLTPAERAVSFHHKRLGPRTAIVAAGPFANFLYSFVVLTLVYATLGVRLVPPEIGRVLPDSAGAVAGFQRGDVVLEINGRAIKRFDEVIEEALINPEQEIVALVRRGEQLLTIRAVPAKVSVDNPDSIVEFVGSLGLLPSIRPLVGGVREGSPADAAGFMVGDLILSLNGVAVASFEQVQDLVWRHHGGAIRFAIRRGNENFSLSATPQRIQVPKSDGSTIERWIVGIQAQEPPLVRLSLFEASVESVRTSWTMIVRTFQYLGQMISGKRGTEDLGGPIRIAQVSGKAAQVGIEQLIMLSVFLSLNLGLVNLFPIPILDGGHLLFYACEAVLRRPLTERMQEIALRFGLAMILMLMVFVTWNDLVNLHVVEVVAGWFS